MLRKVLFCVGGYVALALILSIPGWQPRDRSTREELELCAPTLYAKPIVELSRRDVAKLQECEAIKLAIRMAKEY